MAFMIWRIFGGLFAICVILVAGFVIRKELKVRRLDAKIRAEARPFTTFCSTGARMAAAYSLMHRGDKAPR
jgi:protein tyrosine phosphatase (PTP) superfamily phosphohydrolase (DUF442 family)